ncbi:MAG: hypothetical protein HC945_04215 [Nitrosarchaeum sp.]|nr:hypothetical protein [Nitrosarchaeum sp.]
MNLGQHAPRIRAGLLYTLALKEAEEQVLGGVHYLVQLQRIRLPAHAIPIAEFTVNDEAYALRVGESTQIVPGTFVSVDFLSDITTGKSASIAIFHDNTAIEANVSLNESLGSNQSARIEADTSPSTIVPEAVTDEPESTGQHNTSTGQENTSTA